MATYRYDFTLAGPTTGSLTYPNTVSSSHNSTFVQDTNIFFKQGDTIQVRHTHPLGLNIGLVTSVAASDPDPTPTGPVSGAPGSNVVSRTLTWGSAYSADYFTKWYFFGPNAAGTNVYSSSIIFKKVSATLSSSSTTVVQGGTLTFTASNITGIVASGTNANRLYLSVFNSNGALITTNLSWSSLGNNPWLGKVDSSTTSRVLTIGSSLPTGTYTAYLTHFNNASTSSDNRFYGPGQRMGSTTFTVSAPAATPSAPNAFNLGADLIGQDLNNTVYSTNAPTISGMASPNSGTASFPTGSSGNPMVSVDGGTTYATSATVNNGDTVRVRFTTPTTYSTPRTVTLNISSANTAWAAVSDSVIATTLAQSGGNTGEPTGSSTYGLEVYNSSNKVIFGPNFRSGHLITSGTWSVSTYGTTALIPVAGMTSSNRSTIGVILTAGAQTTAPLTVLYEANGFRVQNNSSLNFSGNFMAIRY